MPNIPTFEERAKDAFWSVILEEPIKKLFWFVFFGLLFLMYFLSSSEGFWTTAAFGSALTMLALSILFGIAWIKKYRQLQFAESHPHELIENEFVALNLNSPIDKTSPDKEKQEAALLPQGKTEVGKKITLETEKPKTLHDYFRADFNNVFYSSHRKGSCYRK